MQLVVDQNMPICKYIGCGREGVHQFKDKSWCCENSANKCPVNRKKNSDKNTGKIFSDTHKSKLSESLTGLPKSIETRRKLSESLKGRVVSESTRQKLSESLKGRIHTNETKKKISNKAKIRLSKPENNPMFRVRRYGIKNPFFGKQHTDSTKHILSEKAKIRFEDPSNHPSWRDGKSRQEYCPDFSNLGWREYIYERDVSKSCWNPQCLKRGSKETLHHIDYDKKNCAYSNIIKICNSCNSIANFNREWWFSFYRIVMEKRFK